jgi:hypothetical protein
MVVGKYEITADVSSDYKVGHVWVGLSFTWPAEFEHNWSIQIGLLLWTLTIDMFPDD